MWEGSSCEITQMSAKTEKYYIFRVVLTTTEQENLMLASRTPRPPYVAEVIWQPTSQVSSKLTSVQSTIGARLWYLEEENVKLFAGWEGKEQSERVYSRCKVARNDHHGSSATQQCVLSAPWMFALTSAICHPKETATGAAVWSDRWEGFFQIIRTFEVCSFYLFQLWDIASCFATNVFFNERKE